jgi:hypothetical protein
MMPYLVDLAVFIPTFWLLYLENLEIKESLVRLLPYVIATDVCYNYFSSLQAESDFLKAFFLLKNYWFFSVLVPLIISILTILLAKKDLGSIKRLKFKIA